MVNCIVMRPMLFVLNSLSFAGRCCYKLILAFFPNLVSLLKYYVLRYVPKMKYSTYCTVPFKCYYIIDFFFFVTVHNDDEEIIELVPNIILNPAFDVETAEQLELDENFNDQLAMRVNNNTVIQPARV